MSTVQKELCKLQHKRAAEEALLKAEYIILNRGIPTPLVFDTREEAEVIRDWAEATFSILSSEMEIASIKRD